MTTIYGLCDKQGKVRYIGKTTQSPQRRLAEHLREAKSGKQSHRLNWIRACLRDGFTPKVCVIQPPQEDDDAAIDDECFWIWVCRDECHYNLVNGTDGGEGSSGRTVSAATREKLRQANLGKCHSDETKARMGEQFTGSKNPWFGKTHSQATLDIISKTHKGKKLTNEQRVALAAASSKPMSAERKAKISAAKMGHKVSEETRRKISEARRKVSP